MNLCVLLVILTFVVTVDAAPRRNRRHLGAILDGILGTASYGYGTANVLFCYRLYKLIILYCDTR